MLLCFSKNLRNCVDSLHSRKSSLSRKAGRPSILGLLAEDLETNRRLQSSLPHEQNAGGRSMALHVDAHTAAQRSFNHADCEHKQTALSIHGSVDCKGTKENPSKGSSGHQENAKDGANAGNDGMPADGLCEDSKMHLPWNRQISFHVQRQQSRKAILVCNRMMQEATIPDKSTHILLLSMRCSSPIALRCSLQVHCILSSLEIDTQSNVILQNILISIYGRFNCLELSRTIFCNLPERTVVSWNAIISAYVQQGQAQSGLHLVQQMMQEGVMGNSITYVSTLHACSSECALRLGMRLHAGIAVLDYMKDVCLNTALVSMYAKCDRMVEAQKLFQEMPERNIVSWNIMISAFARHGQGRPVIELFHELQEVSIMPTNVTFLSIISTFLNNSDLSKAKQVHALVMYELFDANTYIGTALIGMYRRCGSILNAQNVFDTLTKFDEAPWSAMIATYEQYSKSNEAFHLFMHMQVQGVWSNKITYSSILSACSSKTALLIGKRLHAAIMCTSFRKDLLVSNALVSMYGKCGTLDKAQEVFDKMDERNTVTWNAMLDAHALHGSANDFFKLFERMQVNQVPPDNRTFTSMLTICSRLGLVNEAQSFLLSISKSYGLAPSRDHFNCVADLLARSGKLDEAETLLNNMPIPHCAVSMRTLLGACRSLTDINRGERVTGQVIMLDPKSTAPYMILRNLYCLMEKKAAI